jgi:lauroyl/myristoyl acyltransferase
MKLKRLRKLDEATLGGQIAETLTGDIRAAADQWLWMAPRFRLLQHYRA